MHIILMNTNHYIAYKHNEVLTTQEAASADADRIAFIASGSSSSLPPLMSELDEAGAQLIAIHDRPLKTVPGEYSYLIECSGLSYEDYVRISESTDLSLRFLGCFRSESS